MAYLPLGTDDPAVPSTDNGALRRGMLEQAAAAEGVVHTALALGLRPPLSAKQVFDAARAGDEIALAAVEREAQQLARGIAAVAAILDPEMVVLGGGIGHNVDLLRGPLERKLHEITPLRPRIVASKLGKDVVLYGAIATALGVARDLVFQRRAGDRHTPTTV